MLTLMLVTAAFSSLAIPDAKANQEFDRLLASAAVGNLTQNANLKNVDPYMPKKTLLDRYLENPESGFTFKKSIPTTPSSLVNPVMLTPDIKSEAGVSKTIIAVISLVVIILGFFLCFCFCFCYRK